MTELPDEAPGPVPARDPTPAGSDPSPADDDLLPAIRPDRALSRPSIAPATSSRPPVRPVRRDSRVGPPPRPAQWMINQLPLGMLESDFFVRFVSIFQELGSSLLDDADIVQHVPDVSVTPTPLLPHLASWIGMDAIDPSLPEQLQRIMVRSSSAALSWRGTRRGITEYLRMLSGGEATVTDSGGVYPEGKAPGGPAWLRMQIEQLGHLSEGELVALIKDEIPAHVRAELWVGNRRIWASTEDPA